MANIAPYWLATGTVSLLPNGTRTRLAAPVTQTPSTAVPLASTGINFLSCESNKEKFVFVI